MINVLLLAGMFVTFLTSPAGLKRHVAAGLLIILFLTLVTLGEAVSVFYFSEPFELTLQWSLKLEASHIFTLVLPLLSFSFRERPRARDFLFMAVLPLFILGFDPLLILLFLILNETSKPSGKNQDVFFVLLLVFGSNLWTGFLDMSFSQALWLRSVSIIGAAYILLKGLFAPDQEQNFSELIEAMLLTYVVFFNLSSLGFDVDLVLLFAAFFMALFALFGFLGRRANMAKTLISFCSLYFLLNPEESAFSTAFAAAGAVFLSNLQQPGVRVEKETSLGAFEFIFPQLAVLASFVFYFGMAHALHWGMLLFGALISLLFHKRVKLFVYRLLNVKTSNLYGISAAFILLFVFDFFYLAWINML